MWFDNDDEDEEKSENHWQRVGWGLFGAAFAAYMAYDCLTNQEFAWSLFRRGPICVFRDEGKFALGCQFMSLAVYFHFELFWAYFPRLEAVRSVFVRFSVICFFVSTVFAIIYFAGHRTVAG